MKWSKYLKRGCAVILTTALLAGGVNWYSLRLKAVSSSEPDEYAVTDGQDGPDRAGGILEIQTDDSSVPDDQGETGGEPDGWKEGSIPEGRQDEEDVPDTQIDVRSETLADQQTGAEDVDLADQQTGADEADLADLQTGVDDPDLDGEVADDGGSPENGAGKAENRVVIDSIPVEDELGATNDELFEGYLEKVFYGDYGTAPYFLGLEDRLLNNEEEKVLYRGLRTKIVDIADGKVENTKITLEEESVPAFTADSVAGLGDKIGELCSRFLKLLLADCPYELYWFDKTVGGMSIGYSYITDTSSGKYSLKSVTLAFSVSVDYADKTKPDTDSNGYYYVSSDRIERVNTAKENVKAIVKQYAGLSDYDRLKAYKDEICDRTEYDNEALENDKAYGDTWQLVSVFDNDPDTKVVCEGYSKAFAYLCELSSFKSKKIKCYIVSGTMDANDGSGPGAHMWNIVTMDDVKNYLVDVTNSDSNTVGSSGELFLAGTKENAGGAYTFEIEKDQGAWTAIKTITYAYKEETKNLYSDTNILTLADKNYEPSTPVHASIENKNYPLSYTYGDTVAAPVLAQFNITVTGTEDEIVWDAQFRWYLGDKTNQDELEGDSLEAAPKDAGTYTLVVQISAKDCGVTAETKILVTIARAEIEDGWLEAAADWLNTGNPQNSQVYYTGKPYAVTVARNKEKAPADWEPQIQVMYRKDGEENLTENAPADIGTYHVFAKIGETANYNSKEWNTGLSFEIRKFDPKEEAVAEYPADFTGWARSVTLKAPDGCGISLESAGPFSKTVFWDGEQKREEEDGKYKDQTKITYYLNDTASGAVSGERYLYAKIDKTAPEFDGGNGIQNGIQIEGSKTWWQTLLETITLGYYQQKNVIIQASDDLAGVQGYYYYIDDLDKKEDADKSKALTKNDLDGIELEKWNYLKGEKASFQADDSKPFVVYAYAVDCAGNRSDYISSDGIVQDLVKPSILDITIQEENVSDISVRFSVRASENADGFYMVKKADQPAAQGIDDFAVKSEDGYAPREGVKKMELAALADAEGFADGLDCSTEYVIYVIAVDRAGNYTEKPFQAEFTTKKRIPVFSDAEIPVITGVYGQQISEMKLANAEGTGNVPGSWQIVSGQAFVPKVGDTGKYQIVFRPDDKDVYDDYETETGVNVSPRPVILQIQDASRMFGEQDPEFELEEGYESELAAGDRLEDLKISLTTDTDVETAPGTYEIKGKAENPNYEVTFKSGNLTIHKKTLAELPGGTEQRNYPYLSGSGEKREEIHVANKLPDDCGEVTSCKVDAVDESHILKDCEVSKEGVLSYQVQPGAAGNNAVLKVTIETANYEPLYYTVNIVLTEKRQAVPKGTVTLAPECRLTYGDLLSEVIFADIVFVEKGTEDGQEPEKTVAGSLKVQRPDLMPQAGTSEIGWIFTPDDLDTYDEQTGTAEITVEPRQITIENTGYETNYSDTGKEIEGPKADQFTVKGLVDSDGWTPSIQFSWYDAQKNPIAGPPSAAGSYILRAEVPKSNNYTEAVCEVKVTVEPAPAVFEDAHLSDENKGTGGWYHGDVSVIPPEGYLIASGQDGEWLEKIVITQDREGDFEYYLKEIGTERISDAKQISVNRDTAAPEGSIKIAGSMWDRFLETITFGLYTRTEDIVTITAKDAESAAVSGMNKTEYYITDQNEKFEGRNGKEELENLPEESWTVWSDQARITKNRGNIVYARLTDLAGNTAYLSTNIIIHDDAAPVIQLKPDGKAYQDTLATPNAYSESVLYMIEASDANEIENIRIQLDGKEVRSRNEERSVEISEPGSHTLNITAEDKAGNITAKQEQFRVYGTCILKLSGGPSVSDGQPLEPGADFTVSTESTGKISYSYSRSEEGTQTAGLPSEAGSYWIHVNVAEDTQNCYQPQYAAFAYEIKPADGSGDTPGGDHGSGDNTGGDDNPGNTPGDNEGTDNKPGSGNGGTGNTGSGGTGDTGSGNGGSTGSGGNSGSSGSTGSEGNSGNSGSTGGSGNSGNSGSTGGSGNSGNSGGTGSSGGMGSSGSFGNSGGTGSSDSFGGSGSGTGSAPSNTHRTETKPDGTVVETSKQTKPDGTVTETTKETVLDGTVTETEKKTSSDGTVSERVTVTRPNGVQMETVTETKKDGSRKETVIQKHVSGSKTETVRENASDGTTVESVTETASDGSVYATVRSAGADTSGNEISRMTARSISNTGAVTQTIEKAVFTVSRAKIAVTTVKDSKDELVQAAANVTVQGVFSATGSTVTLSGFVTDRIAKEAGTRNVKITVTVKDDKNEVLYKMAADQKDLTAGNVLYVYKYDTKTKKYTMVNDKKYSVSDTKSISVRVPDKSSYVLLNRAKKAEADTAVMQTVKLAKTSRTAAVGRKVKVTLHKNADTESISRITYTSSDTKIAAVAKDGTVKAKARGTARVKAKVTMKNGMTKNLTMKVKVR